MSTKMFCLALIFLGNISLLATPHKFSVEWLAKPFWGDKSSYQEDCYQGFVISRCKIPALDGGGAEKIKTYFKKYVDDQAKKSESWTEVKDFFQVKVGKETQQINAWKKTYTYKGKDSQGSITMRLHGYIGFHQGKAFYYSEMDKIISATGKKERVRGYKNSYRFIPSKTQGYYEVHIWRYYKIQGYWYEPTGIFVSQVKEETLKSFEKNIMEMLPLWAKNI